MQVYHFTINYRSMKQLLYPILRCHIQTEYLILEAVNYQKNLSLIGKINIYYRSLYLLVYYKIFTYKTITWKIVSSTSTMNLRSHLRDTNMHFGAKRGQTRWFFGVQKRSRMKYIPLFGSAALDLLVNFQDILELCSAASHFVRQNTSNLIV